MFSFDAQHNMNKKKSLQVHEKNFDFEFLKKHIFKNFLKYTI